MTHTPNPIEYHPQLPPLVLPHSPAAHTRMSSIKRAIQRARTSMSSKSRSMSPPSSAHSSPMGHAALNGDTHVHTNGHPQLDVVHGRDPCNKSVDRSRTSKSTERPSTDSRPRRLSFTEQKEERRHEREARDRAEAEERRVRQKKLHDEVSGCPVAHSATRLKVSVLTQDPLRDNYGDLPLNMSQDPIRELPIFSTSTTHLMGAFSIEEPRLDSLKSVASMDEGQHVAFQARVHHIRPLGIHPLSPPLPSNVTLTHSTGSKIVFLVFRSQLTTVQGVLTEEPTHVSQNMVRWAEGLDRESVVLIEGIVQRPKDGHEEVRSAWVHEREVKVEKLFVVAGPTATLPFQVEDAARPEENHQKDGVQFSRVNQKTRLSNRVLDLRTPTCHAIFRIHAGICRLFRTFLETRGFLEIHSSKFQETSTEAGAAVFKVDYFRRPAFLAQSPQLAKQMCIAADMERVFEIGPVFRAENSNTHRHLTEFTGLDIEMRFERHYHEVMDTLDAMLVFIFRALQEQYHDEARGSPVLPPRAFCSRSRCGGVQIEAVKKQFPHEDLVVLDKTPRLTFAEGIRMLKEAGWKEDGKEPVEWEDLSTNAERRLGALVKEKYGADYYILDKFPLDVRPFYTMPDPEDNRLSNSFDFFLRGEEILSGGQRIHIAPLLEERMRAAEIDPDTMKDYVDGFRWGCPPHGGGGLGLERVVMLFLKLGDIRWASLFPRDPRSFAKKGKDLAEASMGAAARMILHGPESTTFQAGHPHGELPPLENLIAKCGDATNTSWIDPAWTVWRDAKTGGAVGYIPQGGFAVTFGNPLCELKQIRGVAEAFLAHVQQQGLKPVWCCIDQETERYLAKDLGWSAIVAVAEERLNPVEVDPASNDKTVRRKTHRAERDGVKIIEVEGEMEPQVKAVLEERAKEWEAHRKGNQIHLTGVKPFDDMKHRKYFYAVDKDGKASQSVTPWQLASANVIRCASPVLLSYWHSWPRPMDSRSSGRSSFLVLR
ncbi:hypothetical protein AcW1_003792 [Taiwanofungus camphoratus]|nr:hypothetical protein AcW1_003792 [Antrodia cinnamomea]